MVDIKFYSVVARKHINIPKTQVKEVIKKGRQFLVGKYKIGGKEYEAWKILGMANNRKKW